MAAVDAAAQARGISRSALVKVALATYLDADKAPTTSAPSASVCRDDEARKAGCS